MEESEGKEREDSDGSVVRAPGEREVAGGEARGKSSVPEKVDTRLGGNDRRDGSRAKEDKEGEGRFSPPGGPVIGGGDDTSFVEEEDDGRGGARRFGSTGGDGVEEVLDGDGTGGTVAGNLGERWGLCLPEKRLRRGTRLRVGGEAEKREKGENDVELQKT
jgi:hypothetical protein